MRNLCLLAVMLLSTLGCSDYKNSSAKVSVADAMAAALSKAPLKKLATKPPVPPKKPKLELAAAPKLFNLSTSAKLVLDLELPEYSPGNLEFVTIQGRIQNPMSTPKAAGGGFDMSPIKFTVDHILHSNTEYIVTPNEFGRFRLQVPIEQATPFHFDYNDQSGRIFVSPGDSLIFSCNSYPLQESLRFKGKGAVHNNYLADFARKFNTDAYEGEYQRRLKLTHNTTRFTSFCQDLLLKEQSFLSAYLTNNNTTSIEFQRWARAENVYRCANRISSHYFHTADRLHDGYHDFAAEYNFKDTESLNSNQYLVFLENHLRHLCMRDDPEKRMARIERRETWVIRAYEIAKEHYEGQILEHALTILALTMIEAEIGDMPDYYRDFNNINTNDELSSIVEDHYEKLAKLLDTAPPPGARLTVVKENDEINFEQLVSMYKGKVVYLDFWASWCKPCLEEMPNALQLKKEFAGKDVAFVYLASDDTEGKWRSNIARFQIPGEHYLMSKKLNKDVYDKIMLTSLPRYVLINKQGVIIESFAKRPGHPGLRADINALLSM